MKKILICTLMILVILFNTFNINYAITFNYFSNSNIMQTYNIELLEMFPKTINSMNTDGSIFQRLFKFLENLLLFFEASSTKKIFSIQPILIEANYKYNSQFDIKNEIINEQNLKTSNISRLLLYGTTMDNNGCEVIAVNNALNLMGFQTSIVDLVKTFQKNNIVICDFLINGFFGSNPYSLGKALKSNQIKYNIVSLDELNKEGLYIISYWNSINYNSMLHTVAFQSDGKGNYITYNLYGNGKISSIPPINCIGSYIIGYKLDI